MKWNEMIRGIQNRDAQAVGALVEEKGTAVYQKLYRRTGDHAAARRLSNQVFHGLLEEIRRHSLEEVTSAQVELWLEQEAGKAVPVPEPSPQEPPSREEPAPSGFSILRRGETAPCSPQPPQPEAFPAQAAPFERPEAPEETSFAERRFLSRRLRLLRSRTFPGIGRPEPLAGSPERLPGAVSSPRRILPSRPFRQGEGVPREPSASLAAGERKRTGAVVWIVLTALLAMVLLGLVWVILGQCRAMGLLPVWDLGYSWFNAHVFPFF